GGLRAHARAARRPRVAGRRDARLRGRRRRRPRRRRERRRRARPRPRADRVRAVRARSLAGVRVTEALGLAAAIALAVLLGNLLLVATALVPFWRAVDPEAFLDWFARYARGIQISAFPLGVGSTALAAAAAIARWHERGGAFALVSGLAAAGVA